MSQNGAFFAIEGIDGSGKSTQIPLLAENIKKHTTAKIHLTCEPTTSPIGKVLRQILSKELKADPRVISSLFATDRLNHILEENGMLSRFQQGEIILSDRYYFSSYAYHSVEQELSKIIAENAQNAELFPPTATIYLDIPPEIALERIKASGNPVELYETLPRLTQVRENYLNAFQQQEHKEKIYIINANQSKESLEAEIWNTVKPLLPC